MDIDRIRKRGLMQERFIKSKVKQGLTDWEIVRAFNAKFKDTEENWREILDEIHNIKFFEQHGDIGSFSKIRRGV